VGGGHAQVSAGELRRELARADVLAAPSLKGESFGLVLAEAMAAGVPVVASDIAGYREVLTAGGVLVPPGDAAALAQALGRLLSNDAERRRLADAGRREAAQYAWPRVAEQVLEIYRRVS